MILQCDIHCMSRRDVTGSSSNVDARLVSERQCACVVTHGNVTSRLTSILFLCLSLPAPVASRDRRHTFYGPTVNDNSSKGRRICMKREVPTYPKVTQAARLTAQWPLVPPRPCTSSRTCSVYVRARARMFARWLCPRGPAVFPLVACVSATSPLPFPTTPALPGASLGNNLPLTCVSYVSGKVVLATTTLYMRLCNLRNVNITLCRRSLDIFYANPLLGCTAWIQYRITW